MRWVDWGLVSAVLLGNLVVFRGATAIDRADIFGVCFTISFLLIWEIYQRNRMFSLLARATQRAQGGAPENVWDIVTWIEQQRSSGTVNESRQACELTKMQDTLDAIPVGIVVATAGGRILRTNSAAATLFADLQRIGETLSVQASIRHAEIIRMFDRVASGEQVRPSDVTTLTSPERILRVSGSVTVRDPDSRQVTLVVEDVTDRRRAERVRREFIGNVSHELRTPITAIMATSELLLEEDLPPHDRKRFVQVVARHSERLHTLIRDLLVLSQLDHPTARRSLAREAVSIQEVVETVVKASGERANARGVVVVSSVSSEVEPIQPLHKALIVHALSNLVENAVNHSHAGGRVEILVSKREESLCMAVRDFGVGIEQEHLPRLFERFYRVDKGRSRTEGGSGIGLAIVKHVAVVHGGAVEVTSEVGRGALFSIILPPQGGEGLHRKGETHEESTSSSLNNAGAWDVASNGSRPS